MNSALNLKTFVPQLLVVLGWIMKCQFVEVAGPVKAIPIKKEK